MMLLVTGASGFVGEAVCLEAKKRGFIVRPVTRNPCDFPGIGVNVAVGAIDESTDWGVAIEGCDIVLHLAARAHVIQDATSEPLVEFRKVNVSGTLNLARQAALAGVKRFVFISSIGVNGNETFVVPFNALDIEAPHSLYAISKYEAEIGLKELAEETGMEIVVIRPPLVYGSNAPGNFGYLMRWLSRGLPLPFGLATTNRRSLVGLDNLVDLILTCAYHPNAANQTFLVSDGDDLSTVDFVLRIGKALERPVRLIPVPVSILNILFGMLGKKAAAQSLLGSLQVDIRKTCELLDWKPPVPVDEGLRRAAKKRL
jgi:nucleoside-diphosphate-sugar epimerase